MSEENKDEKIIGTCAMPGCFTLILEGDPRGIVRVIQNANAPLTGASTAVFICGKCEIGHRQRERQNRHQRTLPFG